MNVFEIFAFNEWQKAKSANRRYKQLCYGKSADFVMYGNPAAAIVSEKDTALVEAITLAPRKFLVLRDSKTPCMLRVVYGNEAMHVPHRVLIEARLDHLIV